MNPHIKLVNKNLWMVNFHYVKMGYIQELNFQNTSADAPICLMSDGKIIANSNDENTQRVIPMIEAVMKLPSKKLHTQKGFYIVIKEVIPDFKQYDDSQIPQIIQKFNLEAVKTIFMTICTWEKHRRTLQKGHTKQNNPLCDIKLLFNKSLRKAGEQ